MSRLTALHIHLIGAGAALFLGLILYFAMIKPKQEETKTVQTNVESTKTAGGTQEAVTQKQGELKKQQQVAADTQRKWQISSSYYMPDLRFPKDPLLAYEYRAYGNAGVKDIPTTWGLFITRWYDAQRDRGIQRAPGVTFPVAAYSTDPNAIAKMTYLAFPGEKPWPVTVIARSFDDAMAHLRSFNTMKGHGMPVINNVRLAGQSPDLEVSYDLALYVIPPTTPPAENKMISSGGQASGGGGAPGGFGGYRGGTSYYNSGPPPAGGGGGPQRAGFSGGGGAGGRATGAE